MKFLIYIITNIINQKSYIGWTSETLDKRIKRHLYDLKIQRYKCYLHDAIKSYGWNNFKSEILCWCKTSEKAKILERKLIKKYNTYYLNGFGYNMTLGGDGTCGFAHTLESNIERSQRIKCTKRKHPYKLTDKQIKKVKSARRNQKMDGSHKIWKITFPNGKYEIVHNLSRFSKKHNLRRASLRNVSKTGELYLGYKCECLGKKFNKINMFNKNNKSNSSVSALRRHFRWFDVFDKNNKYLKSFHNINDAANELSLWPSGISSCLHGKIKTSKGYTFQWKN